MTEEIDPDIVLVNIGTGNRAYIAGLIRSLDSCKPAVLGIDAFFDVKKNSGLDSALIEAFRIARNDILAYGFDRVENPIPPQEKFSRFTTTEGFMHFGLVNGLVSRFTPLRRSDNTTHESLALRIIELWKPGFQHDLRPGQSIPIRFTRTVHQFIHIDGSDIGDLNPGLL